LSGIGEITDHDIPVLLHSLEKGGCISENDPDARIVERSPVQLG
jgi:hypothetical protein